MNCPKCGGKGWIKANPLPTPFGIIRYKQCIAGCGYFKVLIKPDGTEQIYEGRLPRRVTARVKECQPDGCQGWNTCKKLDPYGPMLCEKELPGE